MKKPPSPPKIPLLGHIPAFRRDVLGLLIRSVETYGDHILFKLGPHPVYLFNHPDDALHILKKNASNYDKDTRSTRFLSDIAGESVLTSNDKAWQQKRTHLQPAFHRKAIVGFETIMREEAQALVESWEPQSRINASADLTTATFRIVARSLFGTDIPRDTLTSLADPIGRLLTEAFTRLGSLTGRKSKKFKQAKRQLDAVVDDVIAQRQEEPDTPDLLELIRSGNPDPDYVHHESIAFLLAGHETTANALSWMLAYLAQHPEEQERCVDDPEATDRAFHEAMRLSPPIWIIERHAIGEDEVAGYRIPKGASVTIPTYTLHRHPDFWDDPETFKPDRFIDAELHPAGYLPFGLGPRVCIGKEFALMEARLIAAALLPRFRFRLADHHHPEPDAAITLRVKGDLFLTLEDRKN